MKRFLVAAVAASLLVAACGSDPPSSSSSSSSTSTGSGSGPSSSAAPGSSTTLTLVAYDSFAVDPSAFDSFTASTGIAVKIVTAGDAGAMLSKADLTAGNPEGDVMWGVDNTLLSRALAANVFEPYTSPELGSLAADARALVPGHEATPVDEGDVCINYDIAWLRDHDLTVPTSLEDFTKPEYKDLLVVENPATSSPGLAFLLATIAHFGTGDGGWQQYWKDLRANGVSTVDGWDAAYDEQFSGSSGKGPRPFVVSYGSSPPAEVIYGDPRPKTAPTGIVESTCFHQVEFAGVLRGTEHAAEAGKLIDFMVSKQFQELLPLTLFVYPARTEAALPPEFTAFAVRPTNPLSVAPAEIEKNAQGWISTWTDLVLR
jgi:thiamine transport system substrate-binding protein